MAEINQNAPYAPVANVVMTIRRLRERGLPDPLTLQELERIGIPSGNAPRTLSALRFLDLVDDDGHRTQVFERIGRATTGEYEGVLAEVVRASYADVFTLVDPAEDSDIAINDAFRHFQPQAQRGRMVTLFLGLCQEAGITPGGPVQRKARVRRPSQELKPSNVLRPPAQLITPEPVRVDTSVPEPAVSLAQDDTDYRLVSALMQQLPRDGKWTKSKRDRWVQAVVSAVDLLTEATDEDVKFV